MYKLLIMDDEQPVRQAIELSGNWEQLGISERFEAADAIAGLKIVEEHQPDIVLVDMKMPVVSGMEFIHKASKIAPQMKYIIISGFDDFLYAQQALQYHVLDYLLKPVIRGELNKALQKAVSLLGAEKEKLAEVQLNYRIKQLSAPLLKEKLFTTLIEAEGNHPPIVSDMKQWVHETRENMLYGIAILNILNFPEVCSRGFKGDAYSCYYAITNVLNELCAAWNHGFCFKHSKKEHEMIIALELSCSNPVEATQLAVLQLRHMIEVLEQLFGLFSIASIGHLSKEFAHLHASFLNAEDILYSINILQNSESVFLERESGSVPGKTSIMDKKELLIRAFESGSLDYTRHILDDFFASIKQAGYFSVDEARKAATEFMLMVERIIAELGIEQPNSLSPYYKHGQISLPIATFNDFSEFVFHVVSKVFNLIRSHIKATEKVNLNEIKTYIDHNYDREIKLSFFSDKYYLSKEYLSKLFKEEFHYGIYEYVLKVRMEKAKELLDDKANQVQMVSDRLGYNDNNYFSKAFKKYYGISPTEYRATVN